ncbi:uncharacterized protein LOC126815628 isoform X1 [Patella vulgata]|uniref:uncharacterized protein LOC126815628 isoform X1 n=1 Tax=Patella vulgata TaxID=6465 RepID=UPI0021805A46|nr:uncharacterized protein LOC126815628 isoform X1 [Patella vulgata]XP_055955465.1 uncharacterized protein LOC126815628 isoform X1 [Patella vulgata]
MDEESSSNPTNMKKSDFMKYLIKNLQFLCQGHVPFSKKIEVIGHIYLNVDDNAVKYNYFLNEIVTKTDSSDPSFTSNSFQAKPEQENYINTQQPFTSPQDSESSSSTPSRSTGTPKVQIIQTETSSSIPTENDQSPLFLPKIINVQSVPQSDVKNTEAKSETKNISIHVSTPKIDSVVSLAPKVAPDAFTSVSEILKNIKKEPVEESLDTVDASNSASRRKRKPDHTTRIDFSSVKLEPVEPSSPSSNNIASKKPKIMKPRPTSAAILSRKPKPKTPQTDDSSQSSLGDDVPVHFGEGLGLGSDDGSIFPVGLLRNLNTSLDGAGTSDGSYLNKITVPHRRSLQINLHPNELVPVSRKRRRYNSYSSIEKQNAVQLAEIHGVKATCVKFNIPASTLSTWRTAVGRNIRQKGQDLQMVKSPLPPLPTDIKLTDALPFY